MEASRSPDENRQPVDENMPMTDQWTSATPDVTPQRRKSPLSSIRKSSPKNGIPPKRSSVGYKRPPTAVPLSSSRTNASPASHGVSAAGLGKISVRTSGLSNIQRPAAAPSMSATLNSNTRKGATATFSEESSGNGAALEKSGRYIPVEPNSSLYNPSGPTNRKRSDIRSMPSHLRIFLSRANSCMQLIRNQGPHLGGPRMESPQGQRLQA